MNHSHKNLDSGINDYGIFTEIPVLDVKSDIIFPTLFYQFKLDIDNQKIIDECFELKNKFPKGVQKSNMGGWQSEVYNLFSIDRNLTPNIQNLSYNVLLAANDISKEHKLNLNFNESGCAWWININDQYCYNAIHSHPGSSLIALYYPKILKDNSDQGNLSFVRCDGSHHIFLYDERPEYVNYNLNAEEGVIYIIPSNVLHYVKPNKLEETRISIAFNLSIDK
jgi:uncharacterized protein (TIGR02466 family)